MVSDYLSTVPTRRLLACLKAARVDGCYFLGEYGYGPSVSFDEIKAELAKREHVPNKLESKLSRKRRKKHGSSRGRRDR